MQVGNASLVFLFRRAFGCLNHTAAYTNIALLYAVDPPVLWHAESSSAQDAASPSIGRQHVRVDVRRRVEAGMPEDFLYRLHVSALFQ